MTASVSKTYAPQFQLDKRNITTRALCYTISKHHHIFVAQCEKLGLELELYKLVVHRRSGRSFSSQDYKISERDVLIYMMAHEPIFRVKISRLLRQKELGQISLGDIL